MKDTSLCGLWAGRCDVDDLFAARLLASADLDETTERATRREVLSVLVARPGLDIASLSSAARSPIVADAATAVADGGLPAAADGPAGDADRRLFHVIATAVRARRVTRSAALDVARRGGVAPVAGRQLIAAVALDGPTDHVLADFAKLAHHFADLNTCPEYLCDHHGLGHGDSDQFCTITRLADLGPRAVLQMAPGALVALLDALNADARTNAVTLLSAIDTTSPLTVRDVTTVAGLL